MPDTQVQSTTDQDTPAAAGPAKTSSRLAGHALWAAGAAIEGAGKTVKPRKGRGECECGQRSPVVNTTAQRKTWHSDHKDDIRAGGTGVVWEES